MRRGRDTHANTRQSTGGRAAASFLQASLLSSYCRPCCRMTASMDATSSGRSTPCALWSTTTTCTSATACGHQVRHQGCGHRQAACMVCESPARLLFFRLFIAPRTHYHDRMREGVTASCCWRAGQ